MPSLSNDTIRHITNEACRLLYDARDSTERNVLVFKESNGTVIPILYSGKAANGKSDTFPRGEDPSDAIYAHLGALYGRPNEIFQG